MNDSLYPKIETLFKKDEKFKVIIGEYKHPVFLTINTWQWTEKIDGTNIRVILKSDGTVIFRGRTEGAQLHPELMEYLTLIFLPVKMTDIFWTDKEKPFEVILYGEGYGAGIQKGGSYNPKKVFRLFDVLVNKKWWLNWANTCDVANKLGIKTVPYLWDASLKDAVLFCKQGFNSIVAIEENLFLTNRGDENYKAEGIVGRTLEPLFLNNGKRLIVKLKTKDFNS